MGKPPTKYRCYNRTKCGDKPTTLGSENCPCFMYMQQYTCKCWGTCTEKMCIYSIYW